MRQHAFHEQGLLELAKRFPIIDVRGRGLMVAAEFGAPDGGLKAPYGVAAKVTKACGRRNMILLSAGAAGNLRRNLPPPRLVAHHHASVHLTAQ